MRKGNFMLCELHAKWKKKMWTVFDALNCFVWGMYEIHFSKYMTELSTAFMLTELVLNVNRALEAGISKL